MIQPHFKQQVNKRAANQARGHRNQPKVASRERSRRVRAKIQAQSNPRKEQKSFIDAQFPRLSEKASNTRNASQSGPAHDVRKSRQARREEGHEGCEGQMQNAQINGREAADDYKVCREITSQDKQRRRDAEKQKKWGGQQVANKGIPA